MLDVAHHRDGRWRQAAHDARIMRNDSAENRMKLTKLHKDPGSGNGGCETVYLGENGYLGIQGKTLDAETRAQLADVLPGEDAVLIRLDIVEAAIAAYRNQQGK